MWRSALRSVHLGEGVTVRSVKGQRLASRKLFGVRADAASPAISILVGRRRMSDAGPIPILAHADYIFNI